MERSFFDMFSVLEDPRNAKGRVYPLMDVIILAIYGTLIGFEDFTNMSYYLKKREVELTESLGLAAGVPSLGYQGVHEPIRRVDQGTCKGKNREAYCH